MIYVTAHTTKLKCMLVYLSSPTPATPTTNMYISWCVCSANVSVWIHYIIPNILEGHIYSVGSCTVTLGSGPGARLMDNNINSAGRGTGIGTVKIWMVAYDYSVSTLKTCQTNGIYKTVNYRDQSQTLYQYRHTTVIRKEFKLNNNGPTYGANCKSQSVWECYISVFINITYNVIKVVILYSCFI